MQPGFSSLKPMLKKHWVGLLAIGILIVGLVTTSILVQQQQNIRSRAAGSGSVVFVDGSGNPITQTTSSSVNVQITSPWSAHAMGRSSRHLASRLSHREVAAASTFVVYDDALAPGWSDGSYSVTVNYNNTSPVYSGTKSISVSATAWGELEMNAPSGGFSTDGYTHIQFAMRATSANENFAIYLENASFSLLKNPVPLSNYGGYPSTSDWTVYTIPLSDLNGDNQLLGAVTIQNNTGGSQPTVYIDQVQFINTSSPTSTPTQVPLATATPTSVPLATATPTPTSGGGNSNLLYPFTYTIPYTTTVANLPSDADCAATIIVHRSSGGDPNAGTVHRDTENSYDNNRSPLKGYYLQNGTYIAPYRLNNNSFFTTIANAWGFTPSPDVEQKVTGDFTSNNTDEIVQWAACKWGIDVNIVRAQVEMESDFFQGILGDCSLGQQAYPEIAPCQTFGVIGLRGGDTSRNAAYIGSWPYGLDSTAFNLDYSLGVRRQCFMGRETVLGSGYGPGDIWGCVGTWYSGLWHDPAANQYTQTVQGFYNTKNWKNEWAGAVCDQLNSWHRCLYR